MMNEKDELKHFGVKGMKWGIWNEETKARHNGSLRERYKRGGAYKNEMFDKQHSIYKKLQKENERKQKKLEEEALAIANKYGLDFDDGGGGNTEKYTEKQLLKAGRDYMDKWDQIDDLEMQAEKESMKMAKEYIVKQYGDIAIDDIKLHNAVGVTAIIGAMSAVSVASFAALLASTK